MAFGDFVALTGVGEWLLSAGFSDELLQSKQNDSEFYDTTYRVIFPVDTSRFYIKIVKEKGYD